jgi:hypothetical protein
MAMKIGKREQIVVGVIVAVVAIAAVHLFFFAEKAKGESLLLAQRQELISKFNNVAKVPAQADLDKYRKEAADDEQLIWKVVSSLDLLTRPPFAEITPLPTATGPDAEKAKTYRDMLLTRQSVEAQGLVAARLERLPDMAKAFEAGEKWVGETGLVPAEATPAPMKLPFLGTGENGWGLATGVAPALSTSAELWDAVDHVHEAWQVLRLLPSTSSDYNPTEAKYRQNLKALGLDLDSATALKSANQFLPEFRKLMLARAIWQKKGPDENVQVGAETLSLPMLKDMLTFEAPESGDMFLLYRQLGFLEHLLVLARQSGVASIDLVELPSEKVVATYDAAAIKNAKEKSNAGAAGTGPGATPRTGVRVGGRTTPTPRTAGAAGAGGGVGAAMPPTGAAMPPVGAMMPPGMGGAAAVATPVGALPGSKAVAVAQLVNLAYTASNEASMRFLYAIASAPQYYKVEGITVEATKEEGQTKVWLTAQALLLVPGISDGGLLDPKTAEPVPIVVGEAATGTELYTKQLDGMKARGMDEQAVMVKALADAGLPDAAPTPEPTVAGTPPAPAAPPAAGKPAASPPAAAKGPAGAPGVRGGPDPSVPR